MKPVQRLVRSLLSRLNGQTSRVTLSLDDGSLPRVLRDLWPTLPPGAEFTFQTQKLLFKGIKALIFYFDLKILKFPPL